MVAWRRREKRALLLALVVVLAALGAVQYLRSRVPDYVPGETPEGLTDRLGQDRPEGAPQVVFRDVAAQAGLEFEHFQGRRSNRLPEDMGSGVALADVDGDGWTDAFLANGGLLDGPVGRSRLFKNEGGGHFRDITEESGIELSALAMAPAFVDVDSDGDLDLFVTTYGTCRLFENDGRGHFSDVTARAGLESYAGFWTGVAVADYDRDGAMDLYVAGYVRFDPEAAGGRSSASQYGRVIPVLINPSAFEPERNLLLHGNGDGTFREVAEAAGVDDTEGRSLGAVFTDLNGDDWPDLYVANDVSDNALLLNRGDGTFADCTAKAAVGDYRGAMGLAAADPDGDGDLDLFITHWVAQENALYLQEGLRSQDPADPPVPAYFDAADRLGLGFVALDRVGWATRFFDYDNDGNLDLFVVNGSTIPLEDNPTQLEPMRSQLFWNAPDRKHFFDVGPSAGEFFAEEHVGRGGATFDFDLDGDEDLLVALHGEAARLLSNEGGNALPAVRVRLRQPSGNRFAVGARVTASVGDTEQLEVIGSQGSYLSQHAVGEVAFGLGQHPVVDELRVRWPDGTQESAGPFEAASIVTWVRGQRPRVEPFPGRDAIDRAGPVDAQAQRAFYDLRGRAQSARLAGHYEEAAELYREALVRWPGHGDCLYYLGNSLLELGREDEALRAFERRVHFEPQSNAGWMQIGLIRLPGGDPALDDLDLAQQAFERCHELNGEESRPVIELGVVAMLRGELDEAARLFDHAARLNPKSVEALWMGGRVAWLAGRGEEARELLGRARELARTHPSAGTSPSNEGDTAHGRAMTAEGGALLDPLLARWTTTASRDGDPESEYAEAR